MEEWECWLSFPSVAEVEVLKSSKDGEGPCVIVLAVVTFLVTVIKCPTDEMAEGEQGDFGSQFEGTVHDSGEGMVAGTKGSPLVTLSPQLGNIKVKAHVQLMPAPPPHF